MQKYRFPILILGLLLCSHYTGWAQLEGQILDPSKKNKVHKTINFYGETSSLILINSVSANLEVLLFESQSKKGRLLARLGYGFVAFIKLQEADGESGDGMIGAITYLAGAKNSHFEFNGGAFIKTGGNLGSLPLVALGYRFQKPDGRFIFRVNASTLGLGIGLGLRIL